MNRLPLPTDQVLDLLRGEEVRIVSPIEGDAQLYAGAWDGETAEQMSPHTPGESYFVGETLVVSWEGIARYLADLRGVPSKAYKELAPVTLWESATGGPRLPAERMPRAAARLLIECTGVEVICSRDIDSSNIHRFLPEHAATCMSDANPGVPIENYWKEATGAEPDEHVFVSTFRPIEEPAE